MKQFLLQFFTWWRGQTLGTRFYTWRHGERVGEDEFGNTYYKTPDGKRRWVIYDGVVEASSIPSGWHGWMHHKIDTPPTEMTYVKREWELAHSENPTGTAQAYRPQTVRLAAEGKPAEADYEAWTP